MHDEQNQHAPHGQYTRQYAPQSSGRSARQKGDVSADSPDQQERVSASVVHAAHIINGLVTGRCYAGAITLPELKGMCLPAQQSALPRGVLAYLRRRLRGRTRAQRR